MSVYNETIKWQQSFQEGEFIDFKYHGFTPIESPSGIYLLLFTFMSGSRPNGCVDFTFKLT